MIATCSDDEMSVVSYGSATMSACPEVEALESSLVSLDAVDLGCSRWGDVSLQNVNMNSCAAIVAVAGSRNCIRSGKQQHQQQKQHQKSHRKHPPQRVSNFSHNSTTSLLSNSSHGLSKLKRSMSRLEYNHSSESSASLVLEGADVPIAVAVAAENSLKTRRSSLVTPPTRPERVDSYGPGQIQKRAHELL